MMPLEKIQRMAAAVRPDDVCNMQYTSGTTGFPKGVMLTHYNVVNNGKCIGDRMDLSTADRMMIQVPMFHCFGMVLSMTAVHDPRRHHVPHALLLARSASLHCINAARRSPRSTACPPCSSPCCEHADFAKTDFSHMRTGIMAGSGCPPELMKRAARPDEMNMTEHRHRSTARPRLGPGLHHERLRPIPLDVRTETVG